MDRLIVRTTPIGMAGNQVLEWSDIDTEIKSANLKDVSYYLVVFACLDFESIPMPLGPSCPTRPVSTA